MSNKKSLMKGVLMIASTFFDTHSVMYQFQKMSFSIIATYNTVADRKKKLLRGAHDFKYFN